MSRAALPDTLVAILAKELGTIRDGFPNWTDKSIKRLEYLLQPHAAGLACRLSTSGASGTDGVIRMKIERFGKHRGVWFDPVTGLYDFATFGGSAYGDAGGRGLFDFVDFVWRGDGIRLGRAAIANRMSALLGRAFVRSVDIGCRWSWEIP